MQNHKRNALISFIYYFVFGLIIASVMSCAPSGPHKPISPAGEKNSNQKPTGTTYADVKPIFASRCAKCHNSSAPQAPGDWLKYAEIKARVDNKEFARRVFSENPVMPPKGEPQLSKNELELLSAWVANGAPDAPVAGSASGSSRDDARMSAATMPSVNSLNFQITGAAAQCIGCHGQTGVAAADLYPNLAGQSVGYMIRQLQNFSKDLRHDQTMQAMAKNLNEEDMTIVAQYFAEQKPACATEPKEQAEIELIQRGQELATQNNCISCHSFNKGRPLLADFPLLAGQRRTYLQKQLLAFYVSDRVDDSGMSETILKLKQKGLQIKDLEALSAYFSQLKLPGQCQAGN